MKILVFGAGVIGITYAWQMSEAGYDVSLFVRKQRMVRYSHSGISVNCTDLRGNKSKFVKTVYRPKTIDRLDPKTTFDLIVVCTTNDQLINVVPFIAKYQGNTPVLFLGNIWDEFDMIEKHLPANHILFGFPAMVGGGKTENGINSVLFRNSHTLLGTSHGKPDGFLIQVASVLGKSGMQPKISSDIKAWLRTQCIWSAATFGAICKAGNVRRFASNHKIIRQSVMAIREGFAVIKKKQVKAWMFSPYMLFYLPLFIGSYLLKRSYNKEMVVVMEGHLNHGFHEMKKQYYDIMNNGKSFGINMPVWQSFEPYILEAEKNR